MTSARARQVTVVRIASERSFGQERYQDATLLALRRRAQSLAIRELVFTSLRAPLVADRRLPFGALSRMPLVGARALGAALYPAGLVHRLDLRLPPARFEVVTVLDAAPFRFDDEGGFPRYLAGSTVRSVGAICCSAFAAAEAADVFGITRTWIAPAGVAEVFRQARPAGAEVLFHRLGRVPERYVLHAGSASTRKNLPALAAAWRAVADVDAGVELVLVGPPDGRKRVLFDGVPRTHLVTDVATPELASLMAGAAVVVVPSIYEGFGMPVIEAMAAGSPVVAAAATSLPEVVGDAGLLVEPSADGLAAGLLLVLGDDAMAAGLRDKGRARAAAFTWDRTADAHLAAYKEILAS